MSGYSALAKSVIFLIDKGKITFTHKDDILEFIGEGRSAFVFKIANTNKALKVFFPSNSKIAQEEAEIYRILQGIPYFPNLHDAGDNYLVIDLIEGYTLFECLYNGIHITPEMIREIDYALGLARERGLNPSDIHLRNIFITSDGIIKIIDVARFRQRKNCEQWDDLKNAFYRFYRKRFFPKKIPVVILNMIAALYKKKLLSILA